jgi:3-phenylpropionate/cinnamic acid dioxygenase small subunit
MTARLAASQLVADPLMAEMLLQHEIEKFVNIEALILDDRRFEEWLDLFSDDVHYWMPTATNARSTRSTRCPTRWPTSTRPNAGSPNA